MGYARKAAKIFFVFPANIIITISEYILNIHELKISFIFIPIKLTKNNILLWP